MTESPEPARGNAAEVFRAFLRLGLLSFGGPIAHLGYFHAEFVERRRWCTRETFAEIVAIAQSMPGPASSQVGFAIGLLRAGWPGGLAAWTAFTAPSALLMLAFAFGHRFLTGKPGLGIVHGLQLVAAAVVAQAILSMRKSLAPDAPRLTLALTAALIVFFGYGTLAAITVGALFGLLLHAGRTPAGAPPLPGKQSPGAPPLPDKQSSGAPPSPPPLRLRWEAVNPNPATVPVPQQASDQLSLGPRLSKSSALVAAALFFALLFGLPFAASLTRSQPVAVFSAFYRAGALVFGGGHVVLPLLESAVVAPGWVDQQIFLSGYGAAQALPGPLFTFAAFLGASIQPSIHPIALSALALIAIFLPGLLAVAAVLPFWSDLRQRAPVQSILRGVNAAVVGVLIAAWIRPVCSSALHSYLDVAIALAALVALLRWRVPPWIVVLSVATLSALSVMIS